MTVVTKLNTSTLANPFECSLSYEMVGNFVEAGSGKLIFNTVTTTGYRKVWTVRWRGLTAAEVATIQAAWAAGVLAAVEFESSDVAGEHTHVRCTGPCAVKPAYYQAGFFYDVSVTLKEEAPA
jgi:hypothetical protein